MDFSKNIVLKENYTFLVANADAQVTGGERGLYNRDTRFLSRYHWHFSPPLQVLLLHSPQPDRLSAHHALLEHQQQHVAVNRELRLNDGGLVDRLTIEATGLERQVLTLELEFDGDFADLFEVRGWGSLERQFEREAEGCWARLSYRAADGFESAVEMRFSESPERLEDSRARFTVALEPGDRRVIEVEVRLTSPPEQSAPALSYADWRKQFQGLAVPPGRQALMQRAIDDLRALLLFTQDGPLPAAGIPWFVAAFGRDALLTSAMLLPWAPQVAEGALRYLARHQGTTFESFRAEAPGKIMHELRFGELSRTHRAPHSPYYGTVDATALFIVLLKHYRRATGRLGLVRDLQPQWEAALTWMQGDGDPDGDGFLEFTAAEPGKGLIVQSWKDSADSMSHSDGTLAEGSLAVSEVQGYAYEAYSAAAEFYKALGQESRAEHWHVIARDLQSRFHETFWIEELGTYAMALDGAKRPLAVHNSNAGQLLWSGIVLKEVAPRLVETLFTRENWSGWGFRTLGSAEVRYNPVSYHNGSVWPHDSALIAGGLTRYGFRREAARVREALLDLAHSQPDLRLPELVAGYERTGFSEFLSEAAPPVPYPVACRPQAWDAAAVIYLIGL
ncbi:MAG: glycogen debranching N-terminal domain-containing protein [Trueperaceae bacterium]